MGAIVTANYQLGGSGDLDRDQLNQVIQILGIEDPEGKLPIGKNCRYVLVLETENKIPKSIV